MTAGLAAAGLVVAVGNLALVVVCWKSRTALGGVLGVVGLGLVVFSVARGLSGAVSDYSIGIAAVMLVIGAALCVIGQALERLLDDAPDDAVRDERARRERGET
jgi:uncharacterized membrane protein